MATTEAVQRERQRVGRTLREIRLATDLTQEEVAAKLGVTQDRISQIETGKTWPEDPELRKLARIYEINAATRTALAEMIRNSQAGVASWWDAYDKQTSADLKRLLDYESFATEIRASSSSVMPGLLQTRQHAEGLIEFGMVGGTKVRRRVLVEVRARRGVEVFRRVPAVSFHAILTEGVVCNEVGGPEGLRGQLEHLLALARKPNVTLQILHRGSGAAAALCNTNTIMDFGGTRPALVHHDVGDDRIAFDDRKPRVLESKKRFARLASAALSPAQSIDLLEEIRKGL